MKHTMKKLLCMALAIMLLVSAVPVFAMADGNVGVILRGETDDKEHVGRGAEGESIADLIAKRNTTGYEFSHAFDYTTRERITDVNATTMLDHSYDIVMIKTNDNQEGDNQEDDKQEDDKQENGPTTFSVVFKVDSSDNVVKGPVEVEPANGSSATVANVIKHYFSKTWESAYIFDHAWSSAQQKNVALDGEIQVGDTLSVMLKNKPVAIEDITVTIKIGTTVKVDAQPYNAESATINELIRNWNSGWYDDYMLTSYKVGSTTVTAPKTSDVIYAGQTVTINLSKREKEALHDKLSNLKPVILHVYLNNNFNAEHAHYTITSIAEDGTLDLNNDVKNFLKGYYTAKTSDGITYDGMYVADGYFGVKYLADEKYVVLGNDADETGNTTLDRMRSEGYVHLNVMLTNAKVKSSSSSTADSSNPKTGDTIFVPVMVMGATATALAAAYVFGKKRFAR